MSANYTLILSPGATPRQIELQLLDSHGDHLASHQTDFSQLDARQNHALFDLGNYLRHYVARHQHEATLAWLGVLIARQVLGETIVDALWQSHAPRTLSIRLPGRDHAELAALLTRIPWEIARPQAQQTTLAETNLRIYIAAHTRPITPAPPLPRDAVLHILFVYAEAKNSPPLAMRQERRAMAQLFQNKIYPYRPVVIHTLAHGVTRSRLVEQIRSQNGYHILHWSGHGQRNALELARQDGEFEPLSGEDLCNVFIEAGVALPRLVYLSACHSGNNLPPGNWAEFFGDDEPDNARGFDVRELALEAQTSSGGIAHNLLQAGVPTVLAMRYTVGDEYARELALTFYQALLADKVPKSIASALTQARKRMRSSSPPFPPIDHATPLLFGIDQTDLGEREGRSPALSIHERRLPPLPTLAVEPNFVGRIWELAELGSNWLPHGSPHPVAQLNGAQGIGKSALVAEILDLWQDQFNWIWLFQPGQPGLSVNDLFAQLHQRLYNEEGVYFHHVKQFSADAIYQDHKPKLSGPERIERMTQNLIRAMQDEALLLVLDDFDQQQKPGNSTTRACQNPAWDEVLSKLASALSGTHSRLLLGCRQPLATVQAQALNLHLQALPPLEAKLYLRQHPQLRALLYSGNSDDLQLVRRVLNVSGFRPQVIKHLAGLAAVPDGRKALEVEVAAMEQGQPQESRGKMDKAARTMDATTTLPNTSQRGNFPEPPHRQQPPQRPPLTPQRQLARKQPDFLDMFIQGNPLRKKRPPP